MLAATSLGATSKDLTANAEAVTAALARNGQPTSGGPMASILAIFLRPRSA